MSEGCILQSWLFLSAPSCRLCGVIVLLLSIHRHFGPSGSDRWGPVSMAHSWLGDFHGVPVGHLKQGPLLAANHVVVLFHLVQMSTGRVCRVAMLAQSITETLKLG